MLCSAYTPTATGEDAAEVSVPFSPLNGGNSTSWTITRLSFRVKTAAAADSSVIDIEKSTDAGAFSATLVGSVTLNANSYENNTTGSLGTVNSGDKLRFNVTTLGTATNWTVITEISNT
jgi:CCR4-NOT transcriptional regulation complex NOT5 subunit